MKKLFWLLILTASLFAAVGDTIVQAHYIVKTKAMLPTIETKYAGTLCSVIELDSTYKWSGTTWVLLPDICAVPRVFVSLPDGSTAMNFLINATVKVTPTANATYTTTVPVAARESYLIVLTTGTTSRTITFGTGFKTTGNLIALGGGKVYIIHFISDGTTVIEAGRTTAQ